MATHNGCADPSAAAATGRRAVHPGGADPRHRKAPDEPQRLLRPPRRLPRLPRRPAAVPGPPRRPAAMPPRAPRRLLLAAPLQAPRARLPLLLARPLPRPPAPPPLRQDRRRPRLRRHPGRRRRRRHRRDHRHPPALRRAGPPPQAPASARPRHPHLRLRLRPRRGPHGRPVLQPQERPVERRVVRRRASDPRLAHRQWRPLWAPPHLRAGSLPKDNSMELWLLGGELDEQVIQALQESKGSMLLGDCGGELLLIFKVGSINPAYKFFRWDPNEATWVRAMSLGGQTLFLGFDDFAACIGPDVPGVRGDCVYGSLPWAGGWSEYSMIDGTCKCFTAKYPGEPGVGFGRPQVWVLPSLFCT